MYKRLFASFIIVSTLAISVVLIHIFVSSKRQEVYDFVCRNLSIEYPNDRGILVDDLTWQTRINKEYSIELKKQFGSNNPALYSFLIVRTLESYENKLHWGEARKYQRFCSFGGGVDNLQTGERALLFNISAIGFNYNFTEAIFELDSQTFGVIHYIEKNNGTWEFKRNIVSWVE